MPLNTHSGVLGKKRAAHLLRRCCFGASINDIDRFAGLTATEAMTELFREDLPTPPPPIDPLTGQEWITNGPSEDGSEGFALNGYLNRWMIGQMLATDVNEEQQLAYRFRERIVLFFHTHFTTKQSIVGNSRSIYYQQALFRSFAFDSQDITVASGNPDIPDTIYQRNFEKLTEKICVDNAMLVFLDGRLNVRGNPNENFARELLELYSIGRGLEGTLPPSTADGDYFHFTEQDVQEGARVLSGFNVDDTFSNIDIETGLPRGQVRGNELATQHDNDVKTFSFRFQGVTISPDNTLLQNGSPVEESVLDEISQLITLVYNQQETTLHICRKLYRFFVYHEISESLQNDIIQEMADIFTSNNYKIQPVLTALLTSSHFYEAESGDQDNAFGAVIKSPIDLTIGFIKNFNIEVPSFSSDLDNFYSFTGGLLGQIDNMGLALYEPFEVAGYPAYHQFPIFNRSWITTNYLTSRYNFISNRVVAQEATMGEVNIYDFVRTNIPDTIAGNTDTLVIALAEYFLPASDNLSFGAATSELTTERLNYFKSKLLFDGNADPEAYWTDRWTRSIDREDVSRQLVDLINAMLQTPEYQLM